MNLKQIKNDTHITRDVDRLLKRIYGHEFEWKYFEIERDKGIAIVTITSIEQQDERFNG